MEEGWGRKYGILGEVEQEERGVRRETEEMRDQQDMEVERMMMYSIAGV